MNKVKFNNKFDSRRSTTCENCGSNNTRVFKREMTNWNSEDKKIKWLVKMICLDCNHCSGALPHKLFDIDKLPEKTQEQEFQFKARKQFDDYYEYINSDDWKRKTEVWKSIVNYKCEICGKNNIILQAHHKSYENFKHETKKDILIVCENCHKKIHGGRDSFMGRLNVTERENFKKDLI
jgi:hypothetical protein